MRFFVTHFHQYQFSHLTPGVKRPECEADHSHPSGAEECVEPYLLSPIRLHGVALKARDTYSWSGTFLYLY
jgi:hypothetical protein